MVHSSLGRDDYASAIVAVLPAVKRNFIERLSGGPEQFHLVVKRAVMVSVKMP
jgi:hypothetical protein